MLSLHLLGGLQARLDEEPLTGRAARTEPACGPRPGPPAGSLRSGPSRHMLGGPTLRPRSEPNLMSRTLVLLFTLLALPRAGVPQVPERSAGGTAADSLMQVWVEMWATDDHERGRTLYAEDVVSHHDVSAKGLYGIEANVEADRKQMARVGPLQIEPDHSFERGGVSCQTGRYAIAENTGVYTFIFHRQQSGDWKLRYLYIRHDPQPAAAGFH